MKAHILFYTLAAIVTLGLAVPGAQAGDDVAVDGLVNLNPGNNSEYSFVLVTDDGTWITRDDLIHAETDDDGVYRCVNAVKVRITPKATGSQETLYVDEEQYELLNSRTYILRGEFTAKVFKDHDSDNGSAMGKWWVELTGEGTIEDTATSILYD